MVTLSSKLLQVALLLLGASIVSAEAFADTTVCTGHNLVRNNAGHVIDEDRYEITIERISVSESEVEIQLNGEVIEKSNFRLVVSPESNTAIRTEYLSLERSDNTGVYLTISRVSEFTLDNDITDYHSGSTILLSCRTQLAQF